MFRSRPRLAWLCLLASFSAGVFAPNALAQSWTQPARELADKILAHTQSRAGISLSVRNLSSLDSADAADARRAIEGQLRALGIRFASSEQAVEEVEVTLSENSEAFVWVAQIGRSEPRDVVMVTAPLPARVQRGAGTEVVRRLPLVSEPVAILDAAQSTQSGAPVLLVLDVEGIKLYRSQSGRWRLDSLLPLGAGPLPRDPRGRLTFQDGTFTAYLPGTRCSGPLVPLSTATCRPSDEPWPLPLPGGTPVRATFDASHNFFAGPLSPPLGSEKTPFYSATRLALAENITAWLASGLDGTVRLLSPSGATVATTSGWGSELAGANSACGAPYVLASRPGAPDQLDQVRAYRLSGSKMVEVSEPLEFSGPVTELWTEPDGASVLVISKNLKTGDYEASSLSLACGR